MADARTIDEALLRVARGTAGFNDAQTLRRHIQKLGRERDALRVEVAKWHEWFNEQVMAGRRMDPPPGEEA